MTVYRFDNDDVPWWQSVLAWVLLIGMFSLFLKCCFIPVVRPIGEALIKQMEDNNKKGPR